MTAAICVVKAVLCACLIAVTCANHALCKPAPPSGGEGVLAAGKRASVAEVAARDAAARASTNVLGIVAKGVDGEKVFSKMLAGMRERGLKVTLATTRDKIDMPLEEYGHLLLLSSCT